MRIEVLVLVRAALVAWLVAGLAGVWEVLALQWPDSPFHAGVLAAPVAQLGGFAFALGVALLAAAWLWPTLYAGARGRYALALLLAGAALQLGTLGYAAAHGLMAVQIIDPRPDARWLVSLRGVGHGLVLLALLDALVRALRLRTRA